MMQSTLQLRLMYDYLSQTPRKTRKNILTHEFLPGRSHHQFNCSSSTGFAVSPLKTQWQLAIFVPPGCYSSCFRGSVGGRGGDGEAREDEGVGESGGILSSLHTLDIAQLTAGLEKLGQQSESLHVVVDGRQSNTAGEDLVEVSWLVVGQTKSLNVLHVDLDGRSWHKIDITGLESE